jgi:heat shock protein HslJ
MSIDDRDVKTRVETAGLEPLDGFRVDLRSTIGGAMSGEVSVLARTSGDSTPTSTRWWWMGAAAAVAVVATGVVVAMPDDGSPTISPATTASAPSTVPSTTDEPVVAPTSTVDAPAPIATSAVSDPELLASLSGRRWALVSASDGSYDSDAGIVPWISFAADPLIRGNDGCNTFGAHGTIDADGSINIPETESTAEGCDGVPYVNLAAGRHVAVVDGGLAIELTTSDGGTVWTLRPVLPVDDAPDLVGVWAFGPSPADVVQFSSDGVITLGACRTTWSVDAGMLSTELTSSSASCTGSPVAGRLQEALTSGTNLAFADSVAAASSVVLTSGDRVLRLVRQPQPASDVPLVRSDLTTSLTAAGSTVLPFVASDLPSGERRWPVVTTLPDGSFLALDMAGSTLAVYDATGAQRWSVPVPADIDGARPWTAALGPDRVAYLSYQRLTDGPYEFVLVAVPTDGSNAGQAVASWPTDWECVETFCGDVRLAPTGVLLGQYADGTDAVQPWVDDQGQPSGAVYDPPAVATQASESLPPDVLATVPVFEGSDGMAITSARTTVTFADSSWQFDVINAPVAEGTYAWFAAQTDGGVLSTFGVADANRPGEYVTVWLDLLPDGSVQAWRLPADLGYVYATVRVDGGRVAVVANEDGSSFRMVRLVPG